VHYDKVNPPMSEMGQKPALPRRSIGVRFALNKQTLTERVQCDAMCHNRTHAVQRKSTGQGSDNRLRSNPRIRS
jgi:hypothetical protein